MLLGQVNRRSFLGKALGVVGGMTMIGGFARSTNAGHGCWGSIGCGGCYGGGCYGGCSGGDWTTTSSYGDCGHGYGYGCSSPGYNSYHGCASSCSGVSCYGGGHGCYGGAHYHGCYTPSGCYGVGYNTRRATTTARRASVEVARHVPKATCGVPQAASQARYARYSDTLRMANSRPRATQNLALSLLEN